MKIDTLDRAFSIYIRLRDRITGTEYIKCISCGKLVNWKESDAGHFINRKHLSVRFNERNVNAQCRACNRFSEGNIPEYCINLEKKYGKGTINELIVQKNTSKKYSQFEINELVKHYKSQIKQIE